MRKTAAFYCLWLALSALLAASLCRVDARYAERAMRERDARSGWLKGLIALARPRPATQQHHYIICVVNVPH